MKIIVVSILVALIYYSLIQSAFTSTSVFAQTTQSRTNWLEVCRIPIVDALVEEPCETLFTSVKNHAVANANLLNCENIIHRVNPEVFSIKSP